MVGVIASQTRTQPRPLPTPAVSRFSFAVAQCQLSTTDPQLTSFAGKRQPLVAAERANRILDRKCPAVRRTARMQAEVLKFATDDEHWLTIGIALYMSIADDPLGGLVL